MIFRYNDVNLMILFIVPTTDDYFWTKNTLPELKRLKRQVNGLSHVLHKPLANSTFEIYCASDTFGPYILILANS